jgi:aminoglycoside phosphotransferase (APT) family kinase protein
LIREQFHHPDSLRDSSQGDIALKDLSQKFSLEWVPAFEAHDIQTRWSRVHGDLHGGNVLLSEDRAAVLIDYGDVEDGPASLDPVTLELSLLFHKQGVPLADWPSADQARQWGDLNTYFVGCPAASFIRACRAWAGRAGAGQREEAAVAYSYLVRQPKYDDTNKELILSMLDGVKGHYSST